MRRTPLTWAVTAVLVVLALSGCGRVTTDIAVHEDGTYDLSMILAGDETELATAGYTPEAFSTLLTDELASQPGIEDFVVSDYRQDGYAGVQVTGEDVPGDDVGVFGRSVVTTDADEAGATPTDGSADEAITAEDDGADASAWALPLALGLGVLALAGLGTWLVLRNRTDGAQGGPGSPQP